MLKRQCNNLHCAELKHFTFNPAPAFSIFRCVQARRTKIGRQI